MNVLLTVVAFLMALTLIAYARLESFKFLWGTRIEFEKYMENSERQIANGLNECKYENTIAKHLDRSEGKEKRPKDPKAEGSPRINWKLFVNEKARLQDPNAYQVIRDLSERLIVNLYRGNNADFDRLYQANPHVLKDLFNQIVIATESKQKKVRITAPRDLSNLELGDKQSNFLMYLIFNELTPSRKSPESVKAEQEKIDEEDEEEEEDSDSVMQKQEDAREFCAPAGSVMLQNYITISSSNKIRVFLASPPVLLAIFDHPQIVHQVMEMRMALYKEVKQGKDKSVATAEFQQAFENAIPESFRPFINFAVTKSKPKSH